MCWLVVALVTVGVIGNVLLSLNPAQVAGRLSTRATLFLVAGALLLAVALIHRALPDSLCCGSAPGQVQEAIQLAR
jgi:hypothetical protein